MNISIATVSDTKLVVFVTVEVDCGVSDLELIRKEVDDNATGSI